MILEDIDDNEIREKSKMLYKENGDSLIFIDYPKILEWVTKKAYNNAGLPCWDIPGRKPPAEAGAPYPYMGEYFALVYHFLQVNYSIDACFEKNIRLLQEIAPNYWKDRLTLYYALFPEEKDRIFL